eukprot:421975-Pleurochrysis_carterae.AAC.2
MPVAACVVRAGKRMVLRSRDPTQCPLGLARRAGWRTHVSGSAAAGSRASGSPWPECGHASTQWRRKGEQAECE